MRKSGGNGGSSRDRRRARRAAERFADAGARRASSLAVVPEVTQAEVDEMLELVAGASGSTTLPLSDQAAAWDASAAEKSLDPGQFGDAHFWRDPDEPADEIGAYKLPFATAAGGKLTAVWKGVTASAGAVQGARGGVKIPSGDVAGVKTKIAAYYTKAAKEYDDDGIKPPWEADEASGQSAAFLLAYAECDTAELDLFYAEDGETPIGVGGSGEAMDEFLLRRGFWERELSPPEDLALERLDAFQHGVKCECGHAYSEHLGAGGPCGHEDGRGVCSCSTYAEMQVDESRQQAQEFALALLAAAGDVAWGPEEGFVDLLSDLNETLGGYGGDDSPYADAEASCCGYPRAVDVSVKLDKAVIYDGDDCFVAPIAIDANGEPAIAPREQWKTVEGGLIEVAPEPDEAMEAALAPPCSAAARTRFLLREFAFADGDPMLPDAHKPGQRIPKRNASPAAPEPVLADSAVAGQREWTAVFVPEGTLTDDRRAFAPGSLTWRELPLTLMAMIETSEGGHVGAEVAGRIDKIWREGDLIKASGVFDEGDYGQEIARMVADGVLRGLSVDIAIHEAEVGPRSDWFDADGNWLAEKPGAAEEEPSLWDVLDGAEEDRVFVVTEGVIGMATVCPFPAFAQANISLVASGAVWRYSHQAQFLVVEAAPVALVAAAVLEEDDVIAAADILDAAGFHDAVDVPLNPPAAWFADPELAELTPLTITEDGYVFGHAWAWETCHLSFDACVVAPHTKTANAYFHLGEIECSDGERVPVGKITIDAPHAGPRLSREAATRHYDHTGTVAAHVVCGEDEFGGWFAGAIHPEITPEKLRLLRGSALSGDWRGVHGNLELVALLACNVPGFPVPRTRALVASGEEGEPEVLALTAAGIVRQPPTSEEEAEIRALAERAREAA